MRDAASEPELFPCAISPESPDPRELRDPERVDAFFLPVWLVLEEDRPPEEPAFFLPLFLAFFLLVVFEAVGLEPAFFREEPEASRPACRPWPEAADDPPVVPPAPDPLEVSEESDDEADALLLDMASFSGFPGVSRECGDVYADRSLHREPHMKRFLRQRVHANRLTQTAERCFKLIL